MLTLYRGMKADADGKPECGPTKRQLGACIPGDLDADVQGRVHPLTGGMSVTASNPRALPYHRRPQEWGGKGRDPVFGTDASKLGDDLAPRVDDEATSHWLVEPARIMPADAYQRALCTTRLDWEKVTP
jgi:hypothetical protein